MLTITTRYSSWELHWLRRPTTWVCWVSFWLRLNNTALSLPQTDFVDCIIGQINNLIHGVANAAGQMISLATVVCGWASPPFPEKIRMISWEPPFQQRGSLDQYHLLPRAQPFLCWTPIYGGAGGGGDRKGLSRLLSGCSTVVRIPLNPVLGGMVSQLHAIRMDRQDSKSGLLTSCFSLYSGASGR